MDKLSLVVSVFVAISFVFTVSCVTKEVPVTETYYETEYRTEEYTDIGKVVTIVEGEDELKPEVSWWTSMIGWTLYESYLWYSGYYLPEYKAARIKFNTRPKVTGVKVHNLSDVDLIDSPGDLPSGTGKTYVTVLTLPEWPWLKRPEGWKPPLGIDYPPHSLSSYVGFLNLILNDDRLIYESPSWEASSGGDAHEFDISGVTKLAIEIETGGYHGATATVPVSSVKLVWSDELVEEKAVTKQRQVPYEVEKQRTVMQMKKVPFWELFFGE